MKEYLHAHGRASMCSIVGKAVASVQHIEFSLVEGHSLLQSQLGLDSLSLYHVLDSIHDETGILLEPLVAAKLRTVDDLVDALLGASGAAA